MVNKMVLSGRRFLESIRTGSFEPLERTAEYPPLNGKTYSNDSNNTTVSPPGNNGVPVATAETYNSIPWNNIKDGYDTGPGRSLGSATESQTMSRREAMQTMGWLGVLGYMIYKGAVEPRPKSDKPAIGFKNNVYRVVFPEYSPATISRKKIEAQKTILIAQDPVKKMKTIAAKHKKAIESDLKKHGADPRYLEALTFLAYDNMSDPDTEIENIAHQLGENRRVFGRNNTFDILAYRIGNEKVSELVEAYLSGHRAIDIGKRNLTYAKVRFASAPFSAHPDVYNMLHDSTIFEEGSMDYPWKVVAVKELFDELHKDPKAVEKRVKDYRNPSKPSGSIVDFAKRHSSNRLVSSFMKNWVVNLDEPEKEQSEYLALPTDENKFSYRTQEQLQLPMEDIGMVMAVSSLTRFESHTSPLNIRTDGGKIIVESHNCPDQVKGLEYVLARFADMNYIKYTREGDNFRVSRTGDDEATAYFKRIYRLSRRG